MRDRGFLAQAFEWMRSRLGPSATAEQMQALREDTFWGREKTDLVYPIALANLVLHGSIGRISGTATR